MGTIGLFPNLRAEQARRGLTNEEVGKRLGISRVSYEAKMKTGKFKVSEAKTLCELYKRDFNYLFEESDTAG